jgi:cell division protein FtsI/penicillin-binding protein 2
METSKVWKNSDHVEGTDYNGAVHNVKAFQAFHADPQRSFKKSNNGVCKQWSKEDIKAENIKRGLVKLSIMQKASSLINRVVNPVKSFISEWFNITESNLLNTGIYLSMSVLVFITVLLATGVLVFA